ncbi:MAG: ectoine/hydroxyectoine ABC transporter permease subunit EhuC [Gammaproteobacteria bacterium]|nr:ectoine/hydroxyectoine ABC transporter permease subunit EhuC [Gammaproteobacteria bacterium]
MQSYLEFLQQHGSRFVDGTLVTIQQTIIAGLLAIAISLVVGLMKLSSHKVIRWPAIGYIEFFRGTSLLVQLYWIFFVLPLFGITLEKFTAGFIAVGLNLGAYGAELVRGSIQSVPRGQYEAALALNMSPYKKMVRIIFPQALLIMLPPWGNLLIELLKGTALVSLIAVADLMFEAKQINGSTFLSAESFGTALIIYYLMARLVVSPAMRAFEKYWAKKMGRFENHA